MTSMLICWWDAAFNRLSRREIVFNRRVALRVPLRCKRLRSRAKWLARCLIRLPG